jgi:hypothetical protein
MGSDLALVKAAHLDAIAKLRSYRGAKFPGGIATGGVEIDMGMPVRDTRHIEIFHRFDRLAHGTPPGGFLTNRRIVIARAAPVRCSN